MNDISNLFFNPEIEKQCPAGSGWSGLNVLHKWKAKKNIIRVTDFDGENFTGILRGKKVKFKIIPNE